MAISAMIVPRSASRGIKRPASGTDGDAAGMDALASSGGLAASTGAQRSRAMLDQTMPAALAREAGSHELTAAAANPSIQRTTAPRGRTPACRETVPRARTPQTKETRVTV